MTRVHHRINVAAQLAVQFFDEAEQWRAKGDLANEQKALEAGYALLEREGIGSPDDVRVRSLERVAFTETEETARDTDEADAATQAIAAAQTSTNEKTIRDALEGRLTALRQARDAIAAGTIFASLSVNERKVIDALVKDDIGIARLLLRKLEGTD